jgi:HD-GYP domain-containing protein (c-di-GMP phosphodiesterase class II)
MRRKQIALAQLFPVNETLSPVIRQEITLRSCLIFTCILLVILIPINYINWTISHAPGLLMNLCSDLVGLCIFSILYVLNNRHWTQAASFLYLCGAFFISFAAYPVSHPDQVMFYLSLPTLIASLITRKEGSIVMAVLAIIGTLVYKLLYFPYESFSYFSALCLLVIGLVAARVTVILEQILGQMSQAYDKTIEGWSKALEMRNQETEGHSMRVVELTLHLAKFMNIDPRKLPHFKRGVLLHDIGKIAVPDSILCKTGALTPSEIEIMHKHPCFAYDMLKDISYLSEAVQIPYCHHEKWDGTGYPRGMKGKEIPLEARLFSVVDVWDAMRSDRSYRKAIPESQVVEYLRCEKGRSFDPAVIDAFFKMMHFKDPEKRRSNYLLKTVKSTDKA